MRATLETDFASRVASLPERLHFWSGVIHSAVVYSLQAFSDALATDLATQILPRQYMIVRVESILFL